MIIDHSLVLETVIQPGSIISVFSLQFSYFRIMILNHFMLLVSLYTPWKHLKTSIFREYRNRPVSWSRLISSYVESYA